MSGGQAGMQPWEWPECVWSWVHPDYVGTTDGLWFIVLVDAYSRLMEVTPIKSVTTHTTTDKMQTVFATHAIPTMPHPRWSFLTMQKLSGRLRGI